MEHLVFTLVTFVLFTALVGIISGKIVKNSDDQKTAKGYFLAGNGLGGFFIAGSMLLTKSNTYTSSSCFFTIFSLMDSPMIPSPTNPIFIAYKHLPVSSIL